MLRRISLLVFAALVCSALLGGIACRKIEHSAHKGNLTIQAHPFPDAIPVEYGELEGVISGEAGRGVLVFEKDDDTIVLLGVRYHRAGGGGDLAKNAVLIPRR